MNNYITPDVLEVVALDDYIIKILFETKEEKLYDMKKLIKEEKFYHRLKELEYFKRVKPRRETVEWENGEDVCPEELYYNSKTIE